MKGILVRTSTGDEGTFGHLIIGDRVQCATLEPPWKNNDAGRSCILQGSYRAKEWTSPRHGECYWLEDVPGRSEILIHAGNWAGDRQLGRRSDSEGCILVGSHVTVVDGQRGVVSSRVALGALMGLLHGEDLEVAIINAWRMAQELHIARQQWEAKRHGA